MADIRSEDTLYGVMCDVVNCKYHGRDNSCHASKIDVGSHDAVKKSETYCGTFEPRSAVL